MDLFLRHSPHDFDGGSSQDIGKCVWDKTCFLLMTRVSSRRLCFVHVITGKLQSSIKMPRLEQRLVSSILFLNMGIFFFPHSNRGSIMTVDVVPLWQCD